MARVMAALAASRAFSWATRLVFFRTLDFSPPGRSCPPSSRWVTRCQGSRSDRPQAGLPLTSAARRLSLDLNDPEVTITASQNLIFAPAAASANCR